MTKIIKNFIKRKAPNPIKKILRYLYNKWNSRIILDKELIKDLEQYFNLTYQETICMLRIGTHLNKELWNILNPKTEKDIEKFYEINPFYIFSLSFWHMLIGQRNFRNKIIKMCKGDVLDYGGGIGDLCIELKQKGVNVIYADIKGKTFEFAEWFFKKRKYPEIIILDAKKQQKRIWAKEYNTIVCIDTIEHIPHPEGVLEKMARHLKNNGRLIITALECSGPKDDAPMHLRIDFDVEKLLNSFGIFKSNLHDWLWTKTPKL